MGKVFGKLSDADILVIASPVYFYGVNAQLKAMIDRFHSPEIEYPNGEKRYVE